MRKKKDRKKKENPEESESKSQYGTPIQRSESNAGNPLTPTFEPPGAFEAPGKMDRMPGEMDRMPGEIDSARQRDYHIQRALSNTGTSQNEVPEQVLDVIGSGGMRLRPAIQRSLEERMDANFSDVRIHTTTRAAEAADAIDAKAFTCGNDIVFNSGEFDSKSPKGKPLLA